MKDCEIQYQSSENITNLTSWKFNFYFELNNFYNIHYYSVYTIIMPSLDETFHILRNGELIENPKNITEQDVKVPALVTINYIIIHIY